MSDINDGIRRLNEKLRQQRRALIGVNARLDQVQAYERNMRNATSAERRSARDCPSEAEVIEEAERIIADAAGDGGGA